MFRLLLTPVGNPGNPSNPLNYSFNREGRNFLYRGGLGELPGYLGYRLTDPPPRSRIRRADPSGEADNRRAPRQTPKPAKPITTPPNSVLWSVESSSGNAVGAR